MSRLNPLKNDIRVSTSSADRPITDNRSMRQKLELRQWLLGELQITEARVLDLCSGAGHVWSEMGAHVNVAQWVRSDIKPRRAGTLKMSAVQAVNAFDVGGFNVIDIDTWGEPWEPYLAILPKLRGRVAIFLTRGHVHFTHSSKAVLNACGIPPTWRIPLTLPLAAFLDARVLSETWRYADIREAARVELKSVNYYALGLDAHTASRSPAD